EVALLSPVTEHGHGLAFSDPLHAAGQAHVRATGRPVDREVATDRDVDLVEVVVRVAEGLGGFLGCRVGRQRTVRVRVLAVGPRILRAVQARRGREHELPDVVLHAQLEKVERARRIRLDVDPRVLDRLPDACARGEVDHAVDRSLAYRITEQPLEPIAIADVELVKGEAVAPLQVAEPPVLQADVVCIVQVVNGDHAVTTREQLVGYARCNEACGAGQDVIGHVSGNGTSGESGSRRHATTLPFPFAAPASTSSSLTPTMLLIPGSSMVTP